MIGRKITDQTVICKVIKPIDYHNNKQYPLPKSDSNNLLYPTKNQFINQNNQINTPTSGRVFGIPSQNVQVDFDFASEHQNQLNRINSNKEDTQKNSTKPDKFAGSRNVTQFFITNKDKPINIEVKKTISSTNNTVTQSKNQLKKDTETPKIQDTNLKATKVYRNSSEKQQKKTIQNNKSQIIDKNKSEVIDKKTIINKSVMIQKKNDNYRKSITSNSKSKQLSKVKRLQGSKLNNPLESEKFLKSRSSKEINSVAPRPNKGLSKEPKEKSVSNNDKVKQIQKQKIFPQSQMSFRAWQQTLQQQSVEIQNYFPGHQHNKSLQSKEIDDTNKQQLVGERYYEQNESVMIENNSRRVQNKIYSQLQRKDGGSKDNIRKGVQNLRGKQKVKPVQKRYLSVKEEIEQKLKQKRQRLKVQSMTRQKLNKLVIKPETSNDFAFQQGDDQSEEEEEEEERTYIPEPISEVKQLQELSKLHTHQNQVNVQELNQQEENQFLEKDKQFPNTFEEELEGLDQQQFEENNCQPIYNQIMIENDEGINQDVVGTMNVGMKYNYVESSDQDEQQNNESQLKQQIKMGKNNPIQLIEKGKQEQIDFEKYQDYEQTQSQMQKIETNHHIQQKPLSEPIKLNPYPKTNEQAFNKTTTQRQDESSQQQQQEDNPKLQQYLKRRNLISSDKKPSQQPKPLTLSSHSQQHKIKQLLQNYLLQQSDREVIVELEQEYLQSSILVKESCQQPYCPGISPSNNAYSNNDQSVEQSAEYGHDIVVYKNELSDEDQSGMRFQDSSDSEENHQINQSHPPPFVNTNYPNSSSQTQMDQLFSLNLNSLLNKEFIQLNQQTL